MPELLHSWSHVKGPAHVATYNAGGSYILSGGQDRTIKLVNAATGALVNTYSGHGYEVLGIAVSHDNSRFASCGGDRGCVSDIVDLDRSPEGYADVASARLLSSVIYWDVPSSQIIKRFTGHNSRINSVAFNSESTLLASASFDATIRLWDLRSQQPRPIQVLQEAKDSVTHVLVGDREIVSSSVDGHVRTYDLRAGELRTDFFDRKSASLRWFQCFSLRIFGLPVDAVTSVSLTKDSQTILVTTLNSEVHLMDRTDGSELQRYAGHKNTSYRIHNSFGYGEATVLGGDEEGKLWQWDLADGKHVKLEQKIHAKSVLWLEQHPDSAVNQLVTAGADGDVQVWKMG